MSAPKSSDRNALYTPCLIAGGDFSQISLSAKICLRTSRRIAQSSQAAAVEYLGFVEARWAACKEAAGTSMESGYVKRVGGGKSARMVADC